LKYELTRTQAYQLIQAADSISLSSFFWRNQKMTLREVRFLKGLTQFDVARIARCSQTRISQAEAFRVNLSDAEKKRIEKKLGVPIQFEMTRTRRN